MILYYFVLAMKLNKMMIKTFEKKFLLGDYLSIPSVPLHEEGANKIRLIICCTAFFQLENLSMRLR